MSFLWYRTLFYVEAEFSLKQWSPLTGADQKPSVALRKMMLGRRCRSETLLVSCRVVRRSACDLLQQPDTELLCRVSAHHAGDDLVRNITLVSLSMASQALVVS